MKKIGLVLLVVALLFGGYWFYQKLNVKKAVATPEALKTYNQFNQLGEEIGKSYSDLFPINKEIPVTFPTLPDEVVSILSTPTVSSTSAFSIDYSDGVKGYRVEYSSTGSVQSEHGLILRSILKPENLTAQSFMSGEAAYISQELPNMHLFIEIEKVVGGVKTRIFTRDK